MSTSKSHRFVTVALIVCFAVASIQTAGAQASQPATPTTSQDTMSAGIVEGEMLAEGRATGGKLGLGLGVGVLSGLIGTGIGFFVIGPEPMSPEALQRYSNKSPEYQLGFKTGWDRKTKSRKRNAFLAGGLLGTAAFVAIFASARGSQ
jgi:hypothetical protein